MGLSLNSLDICMYYVCVVYVSRDETFLIFLYKLNNVWIYNRARQLKKKKKAT